MRTLVLVFLSCLAVPCSAQSVQETLRARVEQLHDGALTAIRGTALKRREAVTHFFQSRGFEPAWAPAAAEQIVGAVRGIEVDGLNPADYHLERLQPLLSATGRSTADEADLQLLLTDAVAALVDEVRYGRVRPVTLDLRWNVDPRDGAPPLETELASIASFATVLEAIEAR